MKRQSLPFSRVAVQNDDDAFHLDLAAARSNTGSQT